MQSNSAVKMQQKIKYEEKKTKTRRKDEEEKGAISRSPEGY